MKKQQSKFKICFPFVGDSVGGSHVSAALLIQGLSDKFIPVVLVPSPEGPLVDFLKQQHIAFEVLPYRVQKHSSLIMGGLDSVAAASKLRRYMWENRIALVHTNDIRMHWQWSLAAKVSGVDCIWHQRTANGSRHNAAYARLATRVITISRYCLGALPEAMSRRTQVIYNPFHIPRNLLPHTEVSRPKTQRLGITSGTKVVGFIGNLADQKRPLTFVRAAEKILKGAKVPVKFVVVGEKRAKAWAEIEREVAALKLANDIFFIGPQFPVEPWLVEFDVLLAPGVNEGFGRTLVEAMGAGALVIASNDAGHKEVLESEDMGTLVKTDDAEAFAAVCCRLLNLPDEERSRRRDSAHRHALAKYSLAGHVQQIEQLYSEVLE